MRRCARSRLLSHPSRPYSSSTAAIRHRRVFTSSSSPSLPSVECIISTIDKLSVNDFRREAFIPQEPRLITVSTDPSVSTAAHCGIPAAKKWFVVSPEGAYSLNLEYLKTYRDVVLPYEFFTDGHISHAAETPLGQTFERSYLPLEIFLTACRSSRPPPLYIAQAQLLDLPQILRDDLPTPQVILKAGRGDIYESNVWLGIPPTYTALHKDPNPNLFLQLASSKLVRLFKPDAGDGMFRSVQETIRGRASAAFRGDEMMQGPERIALEDAVWNNTQDAEGYEVVVRPGDALYIPKGWWHSIKSIGTDVTASVNWWFR